MYRERTVSSNSHGRVAKQTPVLAGSRSLTYIALCKSTLPGMGFEVVHGLISQEWVSLNKYIDAGKLL